MRSERYESDRRRSARTGARGRVVIHGDRCGGGKILDVSVTGVRVRLDEPCPRHRRDDQVEFELRFDGAKGGWWGMSGWVVRVDTDREIVVAFHDWPTDFEDGVQAELIAAREAARVMHVLLVDPVAARRGRAAASLRATGSRVSEAATPLDAITRLGESRGHPRMIAIADTVPPGIANDLRAYVRLEHADLGLVRMMRAS